MPSDDEAMGGLWRFVTPTTCASQLTATPGPCTTRSRLDLLPSPRRRRGDGRAMQMLEIRLLRFSTGQPHPLAEQPIIFITTKSLLLGHCNVLIEAGYPQGTPTATTHALPTDHDVTPMHNALRTRPHALSVTTTGGLCSITATACALPTGCDTKPDHLLDDDDEATARAATRLPSRACFPDRDTMSAHDVLRIRTLAFSTMTTT